MSTNRKLIPAVLIYALLGFIRPAFSEPRASLVINGKITPPSCDIKLQNEGNVRFNDIPFNQLNQDGTLIPLQTLGMTITCESATRVGVTLTDSSAENSKIARTDVTNSRWVSPGTEEHVFGLGFTGSAKKIKIGGVMIALQDGKVNASRTADEHLASVSVISSSGTGTEPAYWILTKYLAAKQRISWGSAANGPQPVSNVVGTLEISPTIAKSSALPTSDDINFEGKVTLDLVYL
jgi:type 1 fimbria pilin